MINNNYTAGGIPMSSKSIVTIGRQYGSGGREIGQKLAKALDVPCYDKELLTVAAKKSGICEEIFASNDEKPTNSLLYSLVMGGNYANDNLPFNHKLFLAQFDAIRSIADNGPCVIIGRCADYALEDYENCINIFIHADIKKRVDRAVKLYGLPSEKAQDSVIKIDKKRASYYNFYSSQKWGSVDNYDMTLNSGVLGIDNTVEIIKRFVETKDAMRK